MRLRSLIAPLVLLATLSTVAQSSPAPNTTIASDSNHREHPDWNQSCEDRVAAVAGKRVDTIFIGDSITASFVDKEWGGEARGLNVWNDFYGNRFALDFGVGSDKTQNVLWRLDHLAVRDLHPKVAVVMIGTNNPENTPPEIAAGVRAVLDKTQQLFPGVRIILVSILPNRRANDRMMQTNTLIQKFDDGKTVFYLDLVPLFKPDGDNWIGMGKDHLHPTDTGYRLWATAMEPLLSRLLLVEAIPDPVPVKPFR